MKNLINPIRQKIKDSLKGVKLYVLKQTCGNDSYMRICIPMDNGDDFKSKNYCCKKYLNSSIKQLRQLNDIIRVTIDDDTLHISLNGSLRKHIKKTHKYNDVLITNNRNSFDRIFKTKHKLV